MYAAIHSYDEQTFDMSKESEKQTLSLKKNVKKSLWPVPSQGKVEQPKKHGSFRPQGGYPGNALRPQTARWPSIT